MEQKSQHHHRYLYNFEIIVFVLGLSLFSFSLYNPVSSQTGGWATIDPTFDPTVRGSQIYSNTTNSNSFDYIYDTPNSNLRLNQNVQTVSNTSGSGRGTTGGRTSTWGRTSGTNTSGRNSGTNITGGTGSGSFGGSGYYNTTGGSYYGQGVYDPAAIRTQGGYNSNKTSGIYGGAGVNDAQAVRTEGVMIQSNNSSNINTRYINETLATPNSNNTLNAKNCEFITKYHKFGDRGGDVPKIQQFLKDRGYYKGRVDGVYGISTFRAVRNFQKDYRDKILDPWNFDNKSAVEGTGITNIATRYAINNMVGCPDPATIIPKTGKVLNY